MNILSVLKSRFATALDAMTEDAAEFSGMIRTAQDPKFGDYQANCAMPLGKRMGQPPRDIATQLVEQIDVGGMFKTPEVAGPGFINLTIDDQWLQSAVNGLVNDDRLGVESVTTPQKFVIDFSSPNVAKPMHVGHLRSTVLGDALCRILRFLGHDVISDNHIGDWGTQFGMIIYGYKHFLDESSFAADPVAELARLYRLVNQLSDYHKTVNNLPDNKTRLGELQQRLQSEESTVDPGDKKAKKALKRLRAQVESAGDLVTSAETTIADITPELKRLADAHPNIAVDARVETAKLHRGDVENKALWDEFLPLCLDAIQDMYDRLDIKFDKTLGESFYDPMLGKVVDDLTARGLASESAGAVCVFAVGNDAPFIVRKSDGAYTYATTDLATIQYRIENMSAQHMLYVVDARQSEHFNLLFDTARRWGYDSAEFKHVSFGTILGPDKKPYKTRSGVTIGLDGLLSEAVSRARAIVDANDEGRQQLDEQAREKVATAVGIGGIKYADLHHNRDSDYEFSWDKMLATSGDTATYMQYAHARICGIFRRGKIDRLKLRSDGAAIQFGEPAERALALQIIRFGEALDEVIVDYRPNLLTSYLFETANRFSSFYDACAVLKEEDEAVRNSRLLLCDLTARIISHGLSLLGIDSPEMM
jgi:arginyl-tRNA synthetase